MGEKTKKGISGTTTLFSLAVAVLVLMMAVPAQGAAGGGGVVVNAKMVTGEVPLSPDDNLWKDAPGVDILLTAQVMSKPRIYESSIKSATVKALHNGKDIAFLVTWEDKTQDTKMDVNEFSDAVALEFPSLDNKGRPHFAMGDEEDTVNIWYWKAAWQERVKEGEKPLDKKLEYSPVLYTTRKDNSLTIDNFEAGTMAGNPESQPGRPAVQNLVAAAFGTVTDYSKAEKQNIAGQGKYSNNGWSVVFKRAIKDSDKYSVNFSEEALTPLAVAVWNGAEKNRGGQKALSTWYYVGLDTGFNLQVIFLPFITFIAVAGLEWFIIKNRRATGTV